ncbi:MAG TPA: hypothetical protein VHB21_28365, partial [Minicystis sp.]|nr:hypothetical protein [Minicystis sp.]
GAHAENGDRTDAMAFTPEEEATATQALAHVKPRAMALHAEEILAYRAVPAVANANVRKAKSLLARFRSEIPAALPRIDLDAYDRLEDTALALVAAASDADKVSRDGETQRQIALARGYRARLLPALRALAVNGHVPMKAYDDIAAGSGTRDVANDCVDLAVAFRKYAERIAGKHPITDADVAASEAAGTWLLRNLGTRGVRAPKGGPADAVDLRNRVATLLMRDYDQARIVAHCFLGPRYAEVVPPLMSRFLPRRADAAGPAEPPDTPAPSPLDEQHSGARI